MKRRKKRKSSKHLKRHKNLKSLSRSKYFVISAETSKFVNKDSQENVLTAQVVAERKKGQKKENDQDSVAKDTKIVKGQKTIDKKTVTQGQRIESRKKTTETVEKGRTRIAAIKTTRSQRSIRKNTRKTDPIQRSEITQRKDETEIKIMN